MRMQFSTTLHANPMEYFGSISLVLHDPLCVCECECGGIHSELLAD